MLKKVLSIILAAAMTFALCACGNTSKDDGTSAEDGSVQEVDQADAEGSENFPESLTDKDLFIAKGMPTVYFEGTWTKTAEPGGRSGDALAFYVNEDETSSDVAWGLYSWNKSEESLMKEAQASLADSYPKQKETGLYEGDSWIETGDFDYVYYCAFDETSFADFTYCQAYFFEVDETIYELDYFTSTEAVAFDDELQFFGPKCMDALELTEEEIANGMVAARHCNNFSEFCDFDMYVFEKGEDTLDTMTQWFYDEKENVVSVTPYDFESRLGNKYEGIYVIYENTYEGVKYYNETILELIGDKFIAINCYTPFENEEFDFVDPAYIMESAESMSYAIIGY